MTNMGNGRAEMLLVTQRSDNVREPEPSSSPQRPQHQGESNTSSEAVSSSSPSSSEDDQNDALLKSQQQQLRQPHVQKPTTDHAALPRLPRRRTAEKTLVREDPPSPEGGGAGFVATAAAALAAPSRRILRRPRLASTKTAAAAAAAAGTAAGVDGLMDGDQDDPAGGGRDNNKRSKRETLPDIAKRIPIDALRPFLRMPLVSAAKEMNISATTLKRLCRHYGVQRWPFRQIAGIDRTVTRLEAELKAYFHRSAFSAAVTHADAAELREPIAEHIQELKNHREHIIKSTLDGRDEPFRGKLAPSVGVFAALQQHQRRQWQHHNQQQHQQHQQHQQQQLRPAYIDPKEDASGLLQVAPEGAGAGTPGAATWSGAVCAGGASGGVGDGGVRGERAMGNRYGLYVDTANRGGGGGGSGGGGYSGGAGCPSPFMPPSNSTPHNNNLHDHLHYHPYQSSSSLSPPATHVAIVTPSVSVEEIGGGGGGGGDRPSCDPSARAPTAQAVAAAAATVAVETEAAVAMAAEDNTPFPVDHVGGGGGGGFNHPQSASAAARMAAATEAASDMYCSSSSSSFTLSCPLPPPSSSSSVAAAALPSDSCPSVAVPLLRSGLANVSGLGFGCGGSGCSGDGQAVQQEQQQQQQQRRRGAPSYQSPMGREAVGEGRTGGAEGVTPSPSRNWFVVPMTPTSQDAGGRADSRPHHPAYELDLQQQQQGKDHQEFELPQRPQPFNHQLAPSPGQQQQPNSQVHSYDTGSRPGYHMSPLSQQPYQKWSPQENGTSSHGMVSSSNDFMIAAPPAPTSEAPLAASAPVHSHGGGAGAGAGAGVLGTARPRHVREASIDFTLDEVSSLGGEMVFDNRDLYALASTTRAASSSDHIVGGLGGRGIGGGGGGSSSIFGNVGSGISGGRKSNHAASLGVEATSCSLAAGSGLQREDDSSNYLPRPPASGTMQNPPLWNMSTTTAPSTFLSAGGA